MPAITGVSHVSLTVSDLGKSEEWYREVLGFQKVIIPRANQPKAKISGLEVLPVERVDQAVQLLRNL